MWQRMLRVAVIYRLDLLTQSLIFATRTRSCAHLRDIQLPPMLPSLDDDTENVGGSRGGSRNAGAG